MMNPEILQEIQKIIKEKNFSYFLSFINLYYNLLSRLTETEAFVILDAIDASTGESIFLPLL